ncbi:MAG: hypothetical protein KBH78_13355, partial [Candidatus Hydrogenedentes bacterium]|nr:hypothetical protein [Candidatus Hydrogenedentota bacterium]
MNRLINIAGVGAVVLSGAVLVLALFNDPVAADRARLERLLNEVSPESEEEAEVTWNFDAWRQDITGRPAVWGGLVPP